MTTASASRPSARTYLVVWAALVAIVVVEILLTYAHLRPGTQLAALLSLALVEAGIALAYFMHLRYDNKLLTALFVGPLIIAMSITLALMALFGAYLLLARR